MSFVILKYMRGIPISKKEIDKIIKLRSQGYSLTEIMKEIKRGGSTVHKYAKTVVLSDAARKILANKKESSRLRRDKAIISAKQKAQVILGDINKRDLIIFGSALYWAEGAKKDFNLTNTDTNLIKVFLSSLWIMGVKKEDIRASIRIYEDVDVKKALNYWSLILGIPKSQFLSIQIQKGKKVGKYQFGMCRVRVIKAGNYLKLVNAINEVFIEKTFSVPSRGIGPRSAR